MKKSKPSLSISFAPLTRVFHRYHLTLFIVLIIAGLVAAVLLLSNILNGASVGDDYESPISAGTIDQATLDRINALYTVDEPFPPAQPVEGRSSPFTE